MTKPLSALALAAVILPGCLPNAARAAAYDGRWSVEFVTETGPCNAAYNYAVAIGEGQVRLVSGEDGARLSGRVATDGSVGLDVTKGSASGSGTGQLKASNGSGKWSVASVCSGRWTARRSGGQTD